MKHWKNKLLILPFLLMLLSITGCTESYQDWEARTQKGKTGQPATYIDTGGYTGPSLSDYVNEGLDEARDNGQYTETDYSSIRQEGDDTVPGLRSPKEKEEERQSDRHDLATYLADLEYKGNPYICINDNMPYFTNDQLAFTASFESYSELDGLGRTQYAQAMLGGSLMPGEGEERGSISSIKPTGWVQAKYDGIDNGGWLYNRCHLIAWSLAGENDNEKNLMTGTRYFNVEGMLPFEMQTLSYLKESGNHVLYRATPVYKDGDLLAKGLLLEAYSIEDDGELSFCVFLFNVQPGVEIDYRTGESRMVK